MTPIATALKHMLASGLAHESVVKAIEDMEREMYGSKRAKTGQKHEGSAAVDVALDVYKLYAEKAGFSIPRKLTAERVKKISARLAESGKDAWEQACKKMAASSFCRGVNNSGWKADLDFLLQPSSFNRILEGRYDDRKVVARETEFARHQRECTQALERKVYGGRNEHFASDNPAFDLSPGDWRAH